MRSFPQGGRSGASQMVAWAGVRKGGRGYSLSTSEGDGGDVERPSMWR